jgi:7-alpha-hydroxysteroid dehydrogenase
MSERPGPSMAERFRLDGRVALVSGAGRGIGAATARALAEAGADVVVWSRTADEVEAVADAIAAMGRRSLAATVDAGEADAVEAGVEAAVAAMGRLDVVVNVVGGALPRPAMATKDRHLQAAFDHNVVTGIRLVRAAVPHLLATGTGSVVMVSSAIGHLVGRGYLAYGTAKAAVDHSVRMLAAELSPRIRVNAVAPGAVLTEALAFIADDEPTRTAIESATPMRRIGDPEDIAAAVLYLASDAASYVTGQVLAVDGGLHSPNFVIDLPDL